MDTKMAAIFQYDINNSSTLNRNGKVVGNGVSEE